MLCAKLLPELGADLVPALTQLKRDDLSRHAWTPADFGVGKFTGLNMSTPATGPTDELQSQLLLC